ncbi:14625_t:CDS:2, partial [Rhizophagus irregularis]
LNFSVIKSGLSLDYEIEEVACVIHHVFLKVLGITTYISVFVKSQLPRFCRSISVANQGIKRVAV